MAISAQMVKELRAATAAGILDCRKALEATNGDFEKAVDFLREKGLAKVAKRMSRDAKDGMIFSYIHDAGRIGVLVEVNCETDFVARTDEFKSLVKGVALQIAGMSAQYLRREDVPESVLEHEREVYRAAALEEGKPEKIVDRIVEGRIAKFYKDICLMEQDYILDEDKTIEDLIKNQISTIGENIVIRRFARYELGESLGD